MPESALDSPRKHIIRTQAGKDRSPAWPERRSIRDYPLASDAARAALRAGLGQRDARFRAWLGAGELRSVLAVVEHLPDSLADLLPILADPKAGMAVRLGANAVFERHADSPAMRALLPALGRLAEHDDHRVRADACHVLGLAGAMEAAAWLTARLADADPEVREIAADSLQRLESRFQQGARPADDSD